MNKVNKYAIGYVLDWGYTVYNIGTGAVVFNSDSRADCEKVRDEMNGA